MPENTGFVTEMPVLLLASRVVAPAVRVLRLRPPADKLLISITLLVRVEAAEELLGSITLLGRVEARD